MTHVYTQINSVSVISMAPYDSIVRCMYWKLDYGQHYLFFIQLSVYIVTYFQTGLCPILCCSWRKSMKVSPIVTCYIDRWVYQCSQKHTIRTKSRYPDHIYSTENIEQHTAYDAVLSILPVCVYFNKLQTKKSRNRVACKIKHAVELLIN